MRREIIAAASVLALMTGTAMAQSTSPATGNPATGGPTATNMNQTGQSQAGGQLVSADQLLGKNVYGKDNEKIGEVEDVILDTNGQATQLVVSSGGFLGIGEKQVAVDYAPTNWDQAQDRIQLSGMSREDIRNLPEFKYSDTTTSLNRNKDKAGGTNNDATNRSSTGTTGNMGAPSGSTTSPTGTGSPSGNQNSQ